MQKENEIERFIAFTKRVTVAEMMVVTYLLQLTSGNEEDAIAATELIARAGLSEEDIAWHWSLFEFVNMHRDYTSDVDRYMDIFTDGLMSMGVLSDVAYDLMELYQCGRNLASEYDYCCDVSFDRACGIKRTEAIEPGNGYLVMCNVYSEEPRWYGGSYFAGVKDGE